MKEVMSEQADPASTVLTYSATKQREGLFAARFVVLGAMGLVLGALMLFIDASSVISILIATSTQSGLFPADVFGIASFRILLDLLLLGGCVGLILRQRWSRRMLVPFAWGQFADAIVLLLLFGKAQRSSGMAMFTGPGWGILIFLIIIAIRLIVAGVVLYAMRSMHADFYFGEHLAPAGGGTVLADRRWTQRVEKRRPTFVVRGREITSGRDVQYESNAKSEQAARLAAETLGLDPTSVTIEPIPPVPDSAGA
jgi:hypothetical protein